MRSLSAIILLTGLLVQCATDRPSARLEGPLELTLIQRTRKAIHPLGGEISLGVGDITGGQVLVDLRQGEIPLLDTVSMAPGDHRPFPWRGRTLHLQLRSLRNFLVGDDFVVFRVTERKPPAGVEGAGGPRDPGKGPSGR